MHQYDRLMRRMHTAHQQPHCASCISSPAYLALRIVVMVITSSCGNSQQPRLLSAATITNWLPLPLNERGCDKKSRVAPPHHHGSFLCHTSNNARNSRNSTVDQQCQEMTPLARSRGRRERRRTEPHAVGTRRAGQAAQTAAGLLLLAPESTNPSFATMGAYTTMPVLLNRLVKRRTTVRVSVRPLPTLSQQHARSSWFL